MKKKYIGQSTMTANVSSKKVWNLWKDVNKDIIFDRSSVGVLLDSIASLTVVSSRYFVLMAQIKNISFLNIPS